MSTRVAQRSSQGVRPGVALFGLLLMLAAAAVAVSAVALCENELDQMLYVCSAAAAATTGWVLQLRYRRSDA